MLLKLNILSQLFKLNNLIKKTRNLPLLASVLKHTPSTTVCTLLTGHFLSFCCKQQTTVLFVFSVLRGGPAALDRRQL